MALQLVGIRAPVNERGEGRRGRKTKTVENVVKCGEIRIEMEWVDGFEQNKVGKCLGVCHKMQYTEWWGTWPSPMVRKQGGRGGR